jgi:hypothetical protein
MKTYKHRHDVIHLHLILEIGKWDDTFEYS